MRDIVIGTAGHIDHGKSALVKALTGSDPDRLKEEKARGITIDLGFARYQDADLNVAFVDVPGHERFIRNMLAGASGIDGVLLVVAADESVMPQTREHFDICRLLSVGAGLVVLTKCDLVDDETIELVQLETRELVEGSFLDGAPIVCVSARTADGLDALRLAIFGLAATLGERPTGGVARLPIDRAFTVKGFGTVVTGTQVSGEISGGVELEVVPLARRVKVRGVQVHGETRTLSRAGQRVAVNLAGIEVDDLRRGDTLVQPGGVEATRRLDSVVTVLESARPLKHGARVRFHAGTSEVMARVSLGGRVHDRPEDLFPSALQPGEEAFARVRLEKPVALTQGDRFVLRAYSPMVTVAGGRVLDPTPGRGRFRSAAGVVRLRRLNNDADPLGPIEGLIDAAGKRGLAKDRLTPRMGVGPGDVDEVVAALVSTDRAVVLGQQLLTPSHVVSLREELCRWVGEFHESYPLEPGLPREEARERFSRRSSSSVFDGIVAMLVEETILVASDHLAMSSHTVVLSDTEQRVYEAVETRFRSAGLTPPEVDRLVEDLGSDLRVVELVIKLLLREETLVKVESLLFHAESLAQLKRQVVGLKNNSNKGEPVQLDVAAFKARYTVTRKFAIPLLGYLDRARVTRRVGKTRVVL